MPFRLRGNPNQESSISGGCANDLPNEILAHIGQYTYRGIVVVCKRFYNISQMRGFRFDKVIFKMDNIIEKRKYYYPKYVIVYA